VHRALTFFVRAPITTASSVQIGLVFGKRYFDPADVPAVTRLNRKINGAPISVRFISAM
jgi:hypothetical protein